MKKVTFEEVRARMFERAREIPYCHKDDHPVRAVLVFNPYQSNWRDCMTEEYSLASRSYEISSVDKYWHGECGGRSLYGYCLDKDSADSRGVRLDWYLHDDNPWVIDYCYFLDDETTKED